MNRRDHFSALLCALTTSLRTMLASLVEVLSAFVGTDSATRGARETSEDDFGRTVAQVGKAQHAGEETLAAGPNAVAQVGFVNGSVEATLALPGARCAGF